jgi:hypothetical protein
MLYVAILLFSPVGYSKKTDDLCGKPITLYAKQFAFGGFDKNRYAREKSRKSLDKNEKV